jgi:hypothetical protein
VSNLHHTKKGHISPIGYTSYYVTSISTIKGMIAIRRKSFLYFLSYKKEHPQYEKEIFYEMSLTKPIGGAPDFGTMPKFLTSLQETFSNQFTKEKAR